MERLDISLLLVEDDKIIRSIYEQLLRKYVSKIYTAVDGEDGYNKYKEFNPDLILSDIKMPVMNGLDMVKKIRLNDKLQRIIIMSAYGESRFFLKAIETGVKGFLVKPVETDHLLSIMKEQANDILLEKRLAQEEILRQIAEIERDKGDNILKVLSQATAAFFSYGINDSTVNNVLKLVGEEAKVSRAYIFKLQEINNIKSIGHIYEWVDEGVTPQIDNENLISIPVDSPEFEWWAERMIMHKNIFGIIDNFDEPTKSILKSQDIQSILAIPIYVNKEWWGFVGFDDCVRKRIWTNAEINALEMLAFNLGGAIYRKEVEEDMIRLNASLEERVWERTKDLEQEVAERTIAENLLRDSEEKYRLIYENANDGIMLLMEKAIYLVNPKMIEIIGQLPRDIIGKRFSTSLIKPEYVNFVDEYFDNQEKGDSIANSDLQVQMLNGKWLELKSTCISWDMESANLVFVSDITMRKIAEKDLQELNRNLESRIKEEIKRVNDQQQLLAQKSKLESIGELSAGLAHEINQPLGGLSMGIENILFNTSDNGIDEEYLKNKIDLLFKDIERIRKIIEHVRLFSRDQDNLVVEQFSVNEVIENALSLVSKQFDSNNVELVVNVPSHNVFTMGNKYRLEQVILNLLSNSRQAVDEKSNKNNSGFAKQISIEMIDNDPVSIITITDNGIGIKKKIISKIFDPFFTTKSEKKGTGLGLSISYGIISEMQGSIDVDSNEGEFTTITIQLPKI